jgi:hypothetical protein
MDTSDLQQLIEVLAAQLRHARGDRELSQAIPGSSGDSVTGAAAAAVQSTTPREAAGVTSDAGRLAAEMLAAIPHAGSPGDESATTPRGSTSNEDESGPLARVARSLVTGLGVLSFVKGLFGSDGASSPAVSLLPRFELPPAVQQDMGYSSRTGEYLSFDHSGGGNLRVRENTAAPAITINVNAMDSKSFLDHSDEIARAVREAMLNSHALNDVVSEL